MSILEVDLTPEMDQQLRQAASRRGLAAPEYARTALAKVLQEEATEPPKRNIMEFAGVGKNTWQGVDVANYINDLRDEWDSKP